MACPKSATHSLLNIVYNITHWTHIDEMKWSSSSVLGVLAANNLGFGLGLSEFCQTFGQR
jgi:hypothetical protein